MQIIGKELIFSPHDLTSFLEGDFAAWMDRLYFESRRSTDGGGNKKSSGGKGVPAWLVPDEKDEGTDLVARKGLEHEKKFVALLANETQDLVEIPSGDQALQVTLDAMRAGRQVIYQGCLRGAGLFGYPDFLFKVPGACALGEYHYEPWDTKLAHSASPAFVIQLAAYAEMLDAIQGRRPASFTFFLGDGRTLPLKTDSFFYYYRRLKQSFLAFQKGFDPKDMPEPALERGYGRWSGAAEKLLKESDHVSGVARITRTQIKRLEAAGIQTLKGLAAYKKTVPRIQPEILDRLRAQADLIAGVAFVDGVKTQAA